MQSQTRLNPTKYFKLQIPEPSDICLHKSGKSLFIVSDRGIVYETDFEGKILRKSEQKPYDFEAITFTEGNELVVADESKNVICMYDVNVLKIKEIFRTEIKTSPKNGIEAICEIADGKIVIVTEKKPVDMFIYSYDFDLLEKKKPLVPKDISAACYYNNRLWLLSDEDASLYLMKDDFVTIAKSWKLPFSSLEGLAFDTDGNLYVVSDHSSILYVFDPIK
ncbi:MAG: SdiA-regulated domain-containing protein [Bacteroidia bacterium]